MSVRPGLAMGSNAQTICSPAVHIKSSELAKIADFLERVLTDTEVSCGGFRTEDAFLLVLAEHLLGSEGQGRKLVESPDIGGEEIDRGRFERVSRLHHDARLAFGGERLERATKGFYMQPALFTETTSAMRISREEIFGPVANVIQARDYDEALAIANDTELGLAAGICTTSLKYATHFKRDCEAGMVMVNLPTAGVDYHVPFGGRKGSSYGPREQGRYAVEFYTTVKTAYTQP